MAADTTVKYFFNGLTSAPSLTNTAGDLVALLDACLVNGFGLQTVTSVVIASGVGTVTVPSTMVMTPGCVVLFAGATGSYTALNGERKATSDTSTTQFTFDASGLADGTVTGTVTVRYAPAGWAKSFSGTNKAIYKSNNAQSSGMYLRVDDTTATYASVRGYESATGIDAGTNAFPTTTQQSANYWPKASSSVAKSWFVVANDRFFYYGVAPNASYTALYQLYGFGDIVSNKSGDAFRCSLWATNVDASSKSTDIYNSSSICTFGGTNYTSYLARPYYGILPPVGVSKTWLDVPSQISAYGAKTFPNPADNGILFNEIVVTEGSGYRGKLPGIYGNSQAIGSSLTNGTQMYSSSMSKTLLWRSMASTTSTLGGVFFDLTGPWSS